MKTNTHQTQLVLMASLCLSISAWGDAPQIHHLGPTGLTGIIEKNQIRIEAIQKGSPAEGKLKKGDILTGAAGQPFGPEPRRSLADAIDTAETEAGKGRLVLTRQNGEPVELQLEILGSYSDTAPWNCTKSNKIIERAAEAIIASKEFGGATYSGLLGLMATGEQKYIEEAARQIQAAKWIQPDVAAIEGMFAGGKDIGYVGWYWGYNLITLGEYYLLTKDEAVLPAIRTYSVNLARGQDAGGLYGHRMAIPSRNGRLPGYAQMNQSSLSSLMGMLFAEKCGIQDPILLQGIARTYSYYETFSGKGAFNYGVHGPNTKTFNNNGTSGSAAFCMALKQNQTGTAFFSQLCATSYDGLEQGHASTFFNPLWTPLAANLSGPEVSQQFFKESRWLLTMYRSWDGSFSRFGDNQKEGSQTGVALLQYCLPRNALFITGREADPYLFATGKDASNIVNRSKLDYEKMPVAELLVRCNDPIPQVRIRAYWALRKRPAEEFVPQLANLMANGSKREKLSAIGYFGWQCPPEQALPQLDRIGAILQDKSQDPEVRAAAAEALSHMGEPAYKFYSDMLQLVVDDEPGDIFQDVDQSVGASINRLCSTPFAAGLVTNKPLFYQTARKLAHHKRQDVREQGMKMLSEVSLEDFPQVADIVMHIVQDQDDTYHSYHAWQGSIGSAITILANLNIEEGIEYVLGVLDREDGKFGFKVRMICAVLPKYGGNAKDALARLKADPRLKDIPNGRFAGIWNKMVAQIEGDTAPPKLITINEVSTAR